MKILSHRGFWLNPEEKNKQISFKRAVDCGYGIETDIRDYNGKLVISHDIPNEDCLQLDDFLQKYSEQCVDQTQYPIIALMLDIKHQILHLLTNWMTKTKHQPLQMNQPNKCEISPLLG